MTAPAQLEVFAPITKRERDPKTGHLYVYGKITGSDLDHDQQRMDPAWLKTAVPDWFRTGNLREQHDPKRAIGKAIELEEKDDGWYIGAKVVDQSAAEKVEEEVLTGFSIGVKNYQLDLSNKADAPNGTVISGRICETSLVDSPCLGSARITDHWRLPLAKADGTGDLQPVEEPELLSPDEAEKADVPETYGLPTELYERLAAPVKEALAGLAASGATVTAEPETAKSDAGEGVPVVVNVSVQAPEVAKADLSAAGRRKAAAAGAAMEDGSYPIQSKADLRKAIRAVGRGNADYSAIRKHIIKRAKALGLEAMVPENWNADGSLKDANKADEETIAKAEQVLRDVRALAPSLVKADGGDGADSEDVDESEDIAGAEEAIAVIAKLIIAEAESLAMGNLNEACDIDLLLSAVRSLTWFKQREEREQQGDGSDMELADKPVPKTSAPAVTDGDEGDEEEDEDDDEASKSETPTLTKADVTELVKAAVAEANSASEERNKALEAELAKANAAINELKALPQPGGPVLTRTTLQEAEARKSDATLLRAQAKGYLAKADACTSTDRYLAEGYREKARELLAKADA